MARLSREQLDRLGIKLESDSSESSQSIVCAPEQQARSLRRDRVAELILAMHSPDDVARQLGIPVEEVLAEIDMTRKEWASRRLRARAEKVDEELANLEHIRAEAYRAWSKSKQPSVVTTRKVELDGQQLLRVTNPDGSHRDVPVEGDGTVVRRAPKRAVQRTSSGSNGDPRFLSIAVGAGTEIRKLLGIDAPEVRRLEVQNDVNVTYDYGQLVQLDPAKLADLYRDALDKSQSS